MKKHPRSAFAEILAAYAEGHSVTWHHDGYVLTGPADDPDITFTHNENSVGLFHASGDVSSYDPAEFTITRTN